MSGNFIIDIFVHKKTTWMGLLKEISLWTHSNLCDLHELQSQLARISKLNLYLTMLWTVKNMCNIIGTIRKKSGFGWDEKLRMITCEKKVLLGIGFQKLVCVVENKIHNPRSNFMKNKWRTMLFLNKLQNIKHLFEEFGHSLALWEKLCSLLLDKECMISRIMRPSNIITNGWW
jgi:hypothetical protein